MSLAKTRDTFSQPTRIAFISVIVLVLMGMLTGGGFLWLSQNISIQIALLVPFGLVAGGVCLIFLGHIRFVIFLLVLYAPIELFIQKWLPGNIGSVSRFASEALLIMAIVTLLFDRVYRGKPWLRTPLDIPFGLFISAGLLSALVNQVPLIVATFGFRILLRYVLLYYLIIQIGLNKGQIQLLLKWVLLMGAWVVGIGLIQAVVGAPVTRFLSVPATTVGDTVVRAAVTSGVSLAHGRYIFSTLGRYDAFGLYLTIVLLLAISCFLHFPQYKFVLRWLILLSGIALLLTMSRTSWVALYLAFCTIILLRRHPRDSRFLGGLLGAPIFLLVIAAIFPHLVRYYAGDELMQASVLTRMLEPLSRRYFEISAYSGGRLFVLFFIGQRILEISPLVGFGPGRFGSLTAGYFGYNAADFLGMDANRISLLNDVNWIVLLGQYGLLGTLAFALMLLASLGYAWRTYRHTSDPLTKSVALASVGSIVVMLIASLWGPNFEQRVISMYVWSIAGLTVALGHLKHARSN